MSSDLNYCSFIGRLGKPPELRYMPDGRAAASFSIAVGESWKDKQSGEKQERTEWVNVVAYAGLAEICGKYLSKGSQVFISGKQRTRKWQDKATGTDRYTTEIIANEMQMLGSKGGERADKPPVAAASEAGGDDRFFDDDIPF